jgi:prepilin-type N-terminal cleavage/methylation domain-containing protein
METDKRFIMERKNADKGFTLVEVIIAVVILGIVFSPLLQNFIQSARLNKKAREELNATTMAQNIMEGMNAYSAEDIIKSLDSNTNGEVLTILPSGTACGGHGEITPSTSATYGAPIAIGGSGYYDSTNKVTQYCKASVSANSLTYEAYEVLPNSYGLSVSGTTYDKYQFYLQDVELAGVNQNLKYDVIVTLDTEGHETYNDASTAKIASINGNYDCVWQDTSSDRESAITTINSKNPGTSKMNINSQIQRTLYVDIGEIYKTDSSGNIVKDPAGNNVVDDVTVQFKDVYNTTSYGDNGPLSVTKYSKNVTSQDPRNIYIYYWPSYVDSAHKDKIVVKSTLSTNVNVYLIRMSVPDTGYLSATSLTNELDYQAQIEVDGLVNLYTNMYRFVCCEEGSSTHSHDYSVSARDAKISATATNGATIHRELADTSDKNKLYNVTLDVYTAGAIGTSVDESMRLTTFTGGAIE